MIRTDDYYPFGLAFNSSQRTGVLTNKYLYNGKELQTDLNLDWYDYGARMYDAVLGRFHCIDPHADSYHELTPYHYVGNNPLNFIDPTGMDSVSVNNLNMDDFDPEEDIVILDEVEIISDQQEDQKSEDNKGKKEGTSTVAKVIPLAIVSSAADGPIPIGDVIALIILGGAMAYDSYLNPESVCVPIHFPQGIIYSKQDKPLTKGEIEKLKDAGHDPHELKGGKSTGQTDLYKTPEGDIVVKGKGGKGPGEPTGININDL